MRKHVVACLYDMRQTGVDISSSYIDWQFFVCHISLVSYINVDNTWILSHQNDSLTIPVNWIRFFFSFFLSGFSFTDIQRKGEGIFVSPYYHFHSLPRHLDISRVITAESSPLHIACSRTRTGNLCFLSASR